MTRRPRSIFRSRHRPGVLYVGPSPPPPYLAAAVRRVAGDLEPGTVRVATVTHDPGCRRPAGGACTCNPEVALLPRPEDN